MGEQGDEGHHRQGDQGGEIFAEVLAEAPFEKLAAQYVEHGLSAEKRNFLSKM